MRNTVVAIAFLLLLSWPLVTAADRPELVLSVPVAYLYLMVTWTLAVVALFWTTQRRRPKNDRHG